MARGQPQTNIGHPMRQQPGLCPEWPDLQPSARAQFGQFQGTRQHPWAIQRQQQTVPTVVTPQPQPPLAVVEKPVDARAARTKKIAGLAVAGFGIAAIATGAAFGGLAMKAGDDLTRLDQNMQTFDSAKQSAGKNDQVLEAVFLALLRRAHVAA